MITVLSFRADISNRVRYGHFVNVQFLEKGAFMMKVHGPNSYMQLYRNQMRQQHVKKSERKNDQLDISLEAKHLQMQQAQSVEREKYITELKQLVQSGECEVNYYKTEREMSDVWARKV